MSERLRKVEQVLRRELAGVIIEGELRDPRLSNAAAISVTAVKVSADLSSARVYVDVLTSEVKLERVLEGLNAARTAARARLSRRIRMRRVPALSFHADDSIATGVAIERVLAELADERASAAANADPGAASDVDPDVDPDADPDADPSGPGPR